MTERERALVLGRRVKVVAIAMQNGDATAADLETAIVAFHEAVRAAGGMTPSWWDLAGLAWAHVAEVTATLPDPHH